MRQVLLAAVLGTSCLALSGCGSKRVQVPIPIPEDRLDCVSIIDQRPAVPREYEIDWSRVTTVGQARTEHEAFVTRLRERERPISVYIVNLEGALFACANDDQWLRDYLKRLPAPVD